MSYFTTSTLPGLAGEISDYIKRRAARTCDTFADGGALAAMSSLCAARYYVNHPMHDGKSDHINELHVVNLSVMLTGSPPLDFFPITQTVEQLFRICGDTSVSTPEYLESAESVWRRASHEPGQLLLMPFHDHHELLQHDPDVNKHSSNLSKVINELLCSAHRDTASLPISTRKVDLKPHIPPSPLTMLTGSSSRHFKKKLPAESVASPFYGRMLFMPQSLTAIHAYTRCAPPASNSLIAGITALSSKRGQRDTIMLEWDLAAWRLLRCEGILLSLREMENPHEPDVLLIRDHIVEIAALLAIGVDADQPRITCALLDKAQTIAEDSYRAMCAGLDLPVMPCYG